MSEKPKILSAEEIARRTAQEHPVELAIAVGMVLKETRAEYEKIITDSKALDEKHGSVSEKS